MGLCQFWLPTWPGRSWGGAPAGMGVCGSPSLILRASSGTPRSGDPALRPATGRFCTALPMRDPGLFPRPKGSCSKWEVSSAASSAAQGRAHGPRTPAAGGFTTHTRDPALPMLAQVVELVRDREGGGGEGVLPGPPQPLGPVMHRDGPAAPAPLQDFCSPKHYIPTFFLTSQACNST